MLFTEAFCGFLSDCRFEQLSRRDVGTAKRAFLDGTGVCLAGVKGEASRKIIGYLKAQKMTGPSRVVGTHIRTQPAQAALANGILAHSLDFDDVNHPMMGHPTAVLLPVVFALADKARVTGKEAITGYALGLELAAKLGRILNPWHYEQGWHATSSLGTLAAAATAAKLLGLNPAQTGQALGLAASQAGGLRRNFGSMTKPFHAGHAARCGVEAALLAAKEFTAAQEIFEGPMGFFALFGNRPGRARIQRAIRELGNPFELTHSGLAVKQYPCCAGSHPALDAAVSLRSEAQRQGKEPERVRVHVHPLLPRMMIHDRPRTPLEAKFSIRYCVAVALEDGMVTLDSFTPSSLKRKGIARWMDRIEIHPDFGKKGRKGEIPTRAKVVFLWKKGPGLERIVNRPQGSPDRPLPGGSLQKKFLNCAQRAIPGRRAERLQELILGIEEIEDLRRITRNLEAPG